MSRIPVRDALQTLAAEGLVDLRGRAGAKVSAMNAADLQELYELRSAVEPLATGLGLRNAGHVEIMHMEKHFDRMSATSNDSEWLAANNDFHGVLYLRSGRQRMMELIDRLRQQTGRYIALHLTVAGHVDRMQAEHRGILDAARQRDGDLVERLTREHLLTAHEFILRQLVQNGFVADSGEMRSKTEHP